MRFTLLAITTLVASASASTLFGRQNQPACVLECATKAPMGGCADNACLCRNEEFVSQTTLCVEQTCPADQVEQAKEISRQMCLQAGVTLSADPSAPSASAPPGSAAPSGSGAAPSGSAGNSSKPPAPSGSGSGSGSGAPRPTQSGSGGNGAMTHGASAFAGILTVVAAALVL